MPYRTFVDSAGSEWQVWDIVPQLSERRTGERTDRRVELRPIPFADRRREDRRFSQVRRAVLRGTYAQGWLCFENEGEKRRLSPIPQDWTTCSPTRLEAYSREGERVPGAARSSWIDGDQPLAEAG